MDGCGLDECGGDKPWGADFEDEAPVPTPASASTRWADMDEEDDVLPCVAPAAAVAIGSGMWGSFLHRNALPPSVRFGPLGRIEEAEVEGETDAEPEDEEESATRVDTDGEGDEESRCLAASSASPSSAASSSSAFGDDDDDGASALGSNASTEAPSDTEDCECQWPALRQAARQNQPRRQRVKGKTRAACSISFVAGVTGDSDSEWPANSARV
mmetsp:Transcript_113976/g.223569  ORF Transcript_113976/g.223569 Transcript_113976/m.223569 type:complete len:214 (+) Transcript_113976:34-675(+)